MIRLIIIESPYAGSLEHNIDYARRCCLDAIDKNETPFASHLFYPQFLNDASESERNCGINRGLEIGEAFYRASSFASTFSFCVAFYVDRGWSRGMEAALEHWSNLGVRCEVRRLDGYSAPNGSSQIDTPDE